MIHIEPAPRRHRPGLEGRTTRAVTDHGASADPDTPPHRPIPVMPAGEAGTSHRSPPTMGARRRTPSAALGGRAQARSAPGSADELDIGPDQRPVSPGGDIPRPGPDRAQGAVHDHDLMTRNHPDIPRPVDRNGFGAHRGPTRCEGAIGMTLIAAPLIMAAQGRRPLQRTGVLQPTP